MIDELLEQFENFPQELKDIPNWCIAGPDKSPYCVKPGEVVRASVQDPSTWKTFEETLRDKVSSGAPYIGFVLTTEAGYTCIDLDVIDEERQRAKSQKIDPGKWTTQVDFERYNKIIEVFNTYTELSVSGKGAHLWLKGMIGAGARRDAVEVYSQERFMVCTGNAFVQESIKENEEMLNLLIEEIRGANYTGPGALIELEPTEDDSTVWDRAANASNADKFAALVRGEWALTYPSQSEADLALMSMFTFYSKSNEQCRRLFRATELGKRSKAVKNDKYLNYTLEIIRGRQAREAVIDNKSEVVARAFVQSLQTSTFADVAAATVASSNIQAEEVAGNLEWPSGTVGALAHFIYRSSARPVKEIAIVTALGFFAGVTGKAFNIYNSGLNLYVTLVARSAVGKETLHSGISLIVEKLRGLAPQVEKFVDFNELASGPALKKACMGQNSFVHISGEWGKRLQKLASEMRVDGPMHSLRTEMTNLYQKSGRGNLVGGITYSNKDQNVGTMSGVAFSLVGESTPETFYNSLTPTMMEDGFLSRFLVIAYDGERPPLNYDKVLEMPKELIQALCGLVSQSVANNTKNLIQDVIPDEDADRIFRDFDKLCDANVNKTTDESIRQIWNRAHIKVLRVASILAVADNWHAPIVRKHHADWAMSLIYNDINMMLKKINSGDVGGGDDYSRMLKVTSLIRDYYSKETISSAYGVPDGMRESGIVTHRYLQMRTSQISQFRNAKLGSKKALEDSIRMLIDNGHVVEIQKDVLAEKFGYFGRSYRVISLPSLD